MKQKKKKNDSMFSIIGQILKGKDTKISGVSATAMMLSMVLNFFYKLIALVAFFAYAAIAISKFNSINSAGAQILYTFVALWLCIPVFALFLAFWAMGNEARKKTNEDKLITEFSAMISVIALIVAILVK